jgi:FHA domain/Domain of unknown function (DUF1707)
VTPPSPAGRFSLRGRQFVPILHFMGGSAAEMPAAPDDQPHPGLRASDAERDQVVARLRDEYVAGRLSHDTFLHRVGMVLESRSQADLPPMVADLPAPPAERSLTGWLRGTWYRVTAAARPQPGASAVSEPAGAGVSRAAPRRGLTTSLGVARDRGQLLQLQFPRAAGGYFSIGRDAGCDLAIADMTVSRRHAQLERRPDSWVLTDLRSTNGTRVNGWRVRGQVPVRPGDLVAFGDCVVVFLTGDEPVTRP